MCYLGLSGDKGGSGLLISQLKARVVRASPGCRGQATCHYLILSHSPTWDHPNHQIALQVSFDSASVSPTKT